MGTLAASLLLPTKPITPQKKTSKFVFRQRSNSVVPVARLFGPSIFEASKLKVLFLGIDEEKHPGKLPRTYTLTHSDITSKITLAISQTINSSQLQGWYNRLQRDEVVAEWKKVKGKMSLHVHCHISGDHFLLNLFAKLRFYIFCKELPVVIKAFVHGDGNLLKNHPELQESLVWVYFHSIIQEFNRVECWGPLKEAASSPHPQPSISAADCGSSSSGGAHTKKIKTSLLILPQPCQHACSCCFPSMSSIPCTTSFFWSSGPFGPVGPLIRTEPIQLGLRHQEFR